MNEIIRPLGDGQIEISDGLRSAGEQVLAYLQRHFPMGMWTITRVIGERWILLQVNDRDYSVKKHSVIRWSDAFCSRMVRGEGPWFAPDVSLVASYMSAPIGQRLEIGAYVGVPLVLPSGEFFGTLCGIDRASRDEFDALLPDTAKLIGNLLSLVIAHERSALAADRRLSDVLEESKTDALTGLANRRGWDERLALEEQSLEVLGDTASLIVLDLDDLKAVNDRQGHASGDKMLQRTAEAIRSCVRSSDYVARVGGDEFMILASDCDRECVDRFVQRIEEQLDEMNIRASIGSAVRLPDRSLSQAQALADKRMYAEKREGKNRRRA